MTVSHNDKKNISITLSKIQSGRNRTNLLKTYEQQLIAFFLQYIPDWMSSNMLTAIGLFGSALITLGFALANHVNRDFLLISIVGLFINWFGDSLDGRLAYYRNKLRIYYGFVLDFIVDWLSVIFIGYGIIIYLNEQSKLIGFFFIALYGWEMIITLIRYKISNQYIIDVGLCGPTEARIVFSIFLLLEIAWKGSMLYSGIFICCILFIVNITTFLKLLKDADKKDKEKINQKL